MKHFFDLVILLGGNWKLALIVAAVVAVAILLRGSGGR
jgi:hypothetical protein